MTIAATKLAAVATATKNGAATIATAGGAAPVGNDMQKLQAVDGSFADASSLVWTCDAYASSHRQSTSASATTLRRCLLG